MLSLAVFIARFFGEPRFEGRRLSDWLEDPELTEPESRYGVRAIGTNGIPYLQTWLLDDPGWLEFQVRNINTRQNWFNFDYSPSLDANIRAMRGFFFLEELAEPAIPWLVAGLERHNVDFSFYARALLASGNPGREALMKVYPGLSSGEKEQVAQAAYLHVVYDPALAPFFVQFILEDDLAVSTTSMLLVRNLGARCPRVLYDAVVEQKKNGTPAQQETANIVIRRLLDKQPHLPAPPAR